MRPPQDSRSRRRSRAPRSTAVRAGERGAVRASHECALRRHAGAARRRDPLTRGDDMAEETKLAASDAEGSLAERDGSPWGDIIRIEEWLPHRWPFLFVDRILTLDKERRRVTGVKNVTATEPHFPGPCPGQPVM